jgi:hypothetical protein
MHIVTLLTKINNNSLKLKQVKKQLKSTFEDLNVETNISRTTPRGWIQIEISGEDETVVLNYLKKRIGLCPIHLKCVERLATLKGYVDLSTKSKAELYIDVGVFSPYTIDATISLQTLQAQLADGRKIAMGKLAELFSLNENTPLTIKILEVDMEREWLKAELAETQLRRYQHWIKTMLDRLLISGASADEILMAIRKAHLTRDVLDIEPLGMFEHAVVCKLDTNAVGLIPKIGRILRKAAIGVFSPRKILEIFEKEAVLKIP